VFYEMSIIYDHHPSTSLSYAYSNNILKLYISCGIQEIIGMLRRVLKKLHKKKVKKEYPNRFLAFYYRHKKRLNKERRSTYTKRKKKGVCVRCTNNVVPGIIFCSYHQKKQKQYNKNARKKS